MEERWDFSPASASFYRSRAEGRYGGSRVCGFTGNRLRGLSGSSVHQESTLTAKPLVLASSNSLLSAGRIYQRLILSSFSRPQCGCASSVPLVVLSVHGSSSRRCLIGRLSSGF